MYRKAVIRPYRPEDEGVLFGLARLERGADEHTLAVLERETVFVAEIEGSYAGYAALVVEGAAARVDQLFVSVEHEEEDVGRQLLEHVEGFAISRGAVALRVVVEPGNLSAVAFYRSRGFVPAGESVLELVLPRVH